MADFISENHGGNIYKAARTYGLKEEDILDYSSNVNPLGVPDSIRALIIKSINSVINYPDPECTRLKSEIARYLGVEESRIITGNGAAEIIYLLFMALKPKKILIPSPTFTEYERAAHRTGTKVKYFMLKEENGFLPEVDALISSLSPDIDALFLCNPNNPTSVLLSPEDIVRLLLYTSERGIAVIIDETFIELTLRGGVNSVTGQITRFENLFIIRAFTKLFAVPGLRLGYGLGSLKLIEQMWKLKMPWSVNTFALNIGSALRDSGYMAETKLWLGNELDRFYKKLSGIEGIKTFRPMTCFVLMRILAKGINAAQLTERMAQEGILIRYAGNFKFLDDTFFRAAVKDRQSNDRFIQVLENSLKGLAGYS